MLKGEDGGEGCWGSRGHLYQHLETKFIEMFYEGSSLK